MRMRALIVLTACALTTVLPTLASAECTATLNCGGACNLGMECPSPPFSQPWWISCAAGNQVISCVGQRSCSEGANWVMCDGVAKFCKSDWCYQGTDYVRCGNSSISCQQCEDGIFDCSV